MADQLELVLEAERRGILPPDRMAMLQEARKRGLVPQLGIPKGREAELPRPYGVPAPAPAPEAPVSWRDRLLGIAETPISLVSAAIGGVVEPIAGIYGELSSPAPQGSPEATRAGREAMQAVSRGMYRPQSQTGQAIVGGVGDVVNQILPVAPMLPHMPGGGVKPAVRAVTDVVRNEADMLANNVPALVERRAADAAAREAKSWERAPQIEAAQAAQRLKVAVNPAEANPTVGNKVKVKTVGGSDLNTRLAAQNQNRWNNIVKDDLGQPANSKLTEASFDKALEKAAGPYEEVRKIPEMTAPPEVIEALRAQVPPELAGAKGSTNLVRALVDDTLRLVGGPFGRSGTLIVDDIRQLRKDAQTVYRKNKGPTPPDPADMAAADARMKIADILEQMIDANVTDQTLVQRLKEARQRMAQVFDHERAWNPATGQIDPQVYAKALEEGKPLTGLAADIGKVAAVFPDVAQATPPKITGKNKMYRGGAGGIIGAAVGAPLGVVGSGLGLLLGASAGAATNALAARRMGAPWYQAKHAMPTDYRQMPNGLRPVEPNYGPNQMVPYDWANAAMRPDEIPNWTYGRPDVEVGPPLKGAPQLPAPSAESTMNALAGRRRFDYEMENALAQRAAAQAEAQSAATRRPATGERILDLDPITGELRDVSAGLKGTSVVETIRNNGESILSASRKLSENKPFDLTAAEKVAWDKTKVDIAQVLPGYASLPEKVLAERMMDRKWVQDTVTRVREKAAALDAAAKRATDAQEVRQAQVARERLLDFAQELEVQLSKPRPTSRGGQGPKTREFNRNRLILD